MFKLFVLQSPKNNKLKFPNYKVSVSKNLMVFCFVYLTLTMHTINYELSQVYCTYKSDVLSKLFQQKQQNFTYIGRSCYAFVYGIVLWPFVALPHR